MIEIKRKIPPFYSFENIKKIRFTLEILFYRVQYVFIGIKQLEFVATGNSFYFTSASVSFCKLLKLYSKKIGCFVIEKYLIWKMCSGTERNMGSVIQEINVLVWKKWSQLSDYFFFIYNDLLHISVKIIWRAITLNNSHVCRIIKYDILYSCILYKRINYMTWLIR